MSILLLAVAALGGAVAAVSSQKVYAWVTKQKNSVEAKVDPVVATATAAVDAVKAVVK